MDKPLAYAPLTGKYTCPCCNGQGLIWWEHVYIRNGIRRSHGNSYSDMNRGNAVCILCRGTGVVEIQGNRRQVPQEIKELLIDVRAALDRALGDTDPSIDADMTDDEVRDEHPLLWACQKVSATINQIEGE